MKELTCKVVFDTNCNKRHLVQALLEFDLELQQYDTNQLAAINEVIFDNDFSNALENMIAFIKLLDNRRINYAILINTN